MPRMGSSKCGEADARIKVYIVEQRDRVPSVNVGITFKSERIAEFDISQIYNVYTIAPISLRTQKGTKIATQHDGSRKWRGARVRDPKDMQGGRGSQ